MQVAQSMACATAIAMENGDQALQDVDYSNTLRPRIVATPTLAGESSPVLPQVN